MCHEKFFRFFSVGKKHTNHSYFVDHAKKPSGHNLLTYDLAQGFPVWLSFRIIWRHFQNADSQGPFSLPEDSDSEGLGNLYFLQKPFLWCVHTQGYGIADTHLTQPSHFLNFLSVSLKTLITFYTELLFHSMDRDHFLSTCSSVDVFFHSSAAMPVFVSVGYIPRRGTAGSYGCCLLPLHTLAF